MRKRKVVEYRSYDDSGDKYVKLWAVKRSCIMVSHRVYVSILNFKLSFRHNHPDYDRAQKKNT